MLLIVCFKSLKSSIKAGLSIVYKIYQKIKTNTKTIFSWSQANINWVNIFQRINTIIFSCFNVIKKNCFLFFLSVVHLLSKFYTSFHPLNTTWSLVINCWCMWSLMCLSSTITGTTQKAIKNKKNKYVVTKDIKLVVKSIASSCGIQIPTYN